MKKAVNKNISRRSIRDPRVDENFDGNDDQMTALKILLNDYLEFHDGLSEMIESGRLTESDIPDDYDWLVEKLSLLANQTDKHNG